MTYVISEPHNHQRQSPPMSMVSVRRSARRMLPPQSRTSVLLAPAADEVSTAITELFGAYSRDYQAVVKHAAGVFRENEFTRALAAAGALTRTEKAPTPPTWAPRRRRRVRNLRRSTPT